MSGRADEAQPGMGFMGYEALLDALDEAILQLDPEGTVTAVTDAMVEVTGHERERLLGSHISDLVDEVGDDGEPAALLAAPPRSGMTAKIGLTTADDEVRPVEGRVEPLLGDDGPRGAIVVIRADGEAADREQELDETEHQLRSLVDAVEDYAIFVLDADGRVATWNRGAQRIKGYTEEEIVGEHVSTFYTEDDVHTGVPDENLERAKESGHAEDEGWRVRKDGTRFWANVALTAVRGDDDSLQGFVKVTRDVTEDRERERQLERERNLRQHILDTIPVGVALLGTDGTIEDINARGKELFGTTESDGPDTVSDRDVYNADGIFVPPDDRPYREVLETGEHVRNWRCQIELPDPGRRWFSIDADPIRDEDGEVERVVISARDVTKLKEQERRLERQRAELETELESVFERIDDAFFALDDEWRFTYVNAQAESFLGRSERGLLGETIWHAVPDIVDTPFQQQYERAMESNESVSFEEYYAPSDSWLEVAAYPSETGLSVYFRDVSERKAREQELVRFETLFEESGDVNAVLEPDGTFRYLTPSVSNILGYDPETLVGENAFSYVHPDDRANAWEVFRNLIEEPDRGPMVEFRFQHNDGRWVTLEARGRDLLDDPDIEGVVVYTRDVTARKQREQELAQYETIVETIDDGVYVVDDDGRFTMVNQAYEELTGYDREELLGEHVSLVVDQDVGETAQTLERELETGAREEASLEADLLTADGERITAEAAFALLDGETHRRVGVVRDITERKQFEETLRALHASSRDLLDAETAETVDEVVLETAIEVLDLPGGAVYRSDATSDILVPVVERLESGLIEGGLSEVAIDDDHFVAEAFTTGESRMFDNVLEARGDDGDPSDLDLRAGLFVPIGSHGVLAVGSRKVAAFDETTRQLVEHLAANAATAYDRADRERELRDHADQQEAVARLGRRALEHRDLDALFDEAALLVSAVLGTDFCKVLDLGPDGRELTLRASIGWDSPPGENPTIATGSDTQAEYTLESAKPVVVTDFDAESRFTKPAFPRERDVRSGISVVIGPATDPWGVLATHDDEVWEFTDSDVTFVNSVSTILATAIERDRRERQIERHRDQLSLAVQLDQITQSVNEAVLEASSRNEVERIVCHQLAGTDLYDAAWFGNVDLVDGEIQPASAAGIDIERLDPIPYASENGTAQDPTAVAVGTGEMVIERAPLDSHAGDEIDTDVEVVAAIPISFEDVRYGVLTVWTTRANAFEEYESTISERLGRSVGHAMNALDRKVALQSENRIEIEARVPDVLSDWRVDASRDEYTITIEGTIGTDENTVVQYVTTSGLSTEEATSAFETLPGAESVREIGDEDDPRRFEIIYADPPVTATLASVGGRVTDVTFDGTDQVILGELPQSVDSRQIIETLQADHESVDVEIRRTVSGVDAKDDRAGVMNLQSLTDRQRSALHMAFSGGFFKWPRDQTGEDLAESMGVAPATFHQHLRAAQRKVFAAVFDR